MVQEFSDVNSGKWRLTAWQYIPSDQTGSAYFILLNTYSPTQSWSTQLRFSATEGIAVDYDDTSKTLPLVTDEWVQIRVDIDFVADQQVIYYNNDILNTKSWTDGASGGGALNLACVDLWAGDTSSPSTTFYYDDLVLAEVLPLSCDAYGPYEGLVDEDIEMDGTATGGLAPYQYLWDFGDGNTSGDPHPTHNYANAGIYTVNLTVTDAEQSTAFDETTATINGPPNEPTITGPDGDAGTSYPYDFVAEDPELDDIAEFLVDWDDGNEETITGPFASGETATKSHTFATGGTFEITARAKDINGLVGPEGTLTVTMPRNRAINNPFLNFLQQHPILYQLLQRFLRL
jgi:chitodextrinase